MQFLMPKNKQAPPWMRVVEGGKPAPLTDAQKRQKLRDERERAARSKGNP